MFTCLLNILTQIANRYLITDSANMTLSIFPLPSGLFWPITAKLPALQFMTIYDITIGVIIDFFPVFYKTNIQSMSTSHWGCF